MIVDHRKYKGNAEGSYTEILITKSNTKTNSEKLVNSMYLSNTCASTVPCSVFLRKRNARQVFSPAEPKSSAGWFDLYIIKDLNIPPNTSVEILSDFKYDYNFHLMFTITGSASLTLDMILKYE
jgi:hypothetical protein